MGFPFLKQDMFFLFFFAFQTLPVQLLFFTSQTVLKNFSEDVGYICYCIFVPCTTQMTQDKIDSLVEQHDGES